MFRVFCPDCALSIRASVLLFQLISLISAEVFVLLNRKDCFGMFRKRLSKFQIADPRFNAAARPLLIADINTHAHTHTHTDEVPSINCACAIKQTLSGTARVARLVRVFAELCETLCLLPLPIFLNFPRISTLLAAPHAPSHSIAVHTLCSGISGHFWPFRAISSNKSRQRLKTFRGPESSRRSGQSGAAQEAATSESKLKEIYLLCH